MARRTDRGGTGATRPSPTRTALGAEAAMALADDDAPAFVARRMNAFASMFLDIDN
jgi:hypothetical protein